MNKRVHTMIMGLLLGLLCLTYADVYLGGDLKLILGDISSGTAWITDSLGTAEYDTTDRFSLGFSHVTLYFMGNIGDNVSVTIQPEILAHASATPKLGKRIGEQRPSDAEHVEIEIALATITYVTPGAFEITAGYLRPLFTEDYGNEKFYQENITSHKAICNPWLGVMHDAGIEIYKSFDAKVGNNYAAFPVWLYAINGGYSIADNNTDKAFMVHIAPEYANFTLYGSAAYGKWDDEDENTFLRYSGGLGYSHRYFWLRGEYMTGTWENEYTWAGDTFDVEPMGYYAKLGINLIPEKLTLMAYYDYAEHNFSGFFYVGGTMKETYATYSGILNYQVVPGSHIMLQVDKADWKNEDETSKLDYIRGTLGLRTIF